MDITEILTSSEAARAAVVALHDDIDTLYSSCRDGGAWSFTDLSAEQLEGCGSILAKAENTALILQKKVGMLKEIYSAALVAYTPAEES